jgi:hypothetical protein
MIQIVSQLCRGFVLQIEDRLVMAEKDGGPDKFDALANKNVVYWARDRTLLAPRSS